MKLSSFTKYLRLRVINTEVRGLVPLLLMVMLLRPVTLMAQDGAGKLKPGGGPAPGIRGDVSSVPGDLFRVLGEAVELRHAADSLAVRAEKAAQAVADAPSADRLRMEGRAAAEASKESAVSARADSLLLSSLKGNSRSGVVSVQENQTRALFKVRPGQAYSEANPVPVEPSVPQGLIYSVQIATFRNSVSPALFRGLWPVFGKRRQGSEAIYYYTGMFRRIEDARKALPDARAAGFPDAFIIAFMDGIQVSMERAALLEADWSARPIDVDGTFTSRNTARPGTLDQGRQPVRSQTQEQSVQASRQQAEDQPVNPVPVGTLYFRAEVMRIDKPVKPEVIQKVEQLAGTRGLDMVKNNMGETVFLIGNFITFESADEYVSLLVRNGYNSARVAAYVGLQEIPVEAARELINKLPDD
jgi:hypothetical protein